MIRAMLATLSAQVFRALGDPTRLRLMALLRKGEVCVGDLVTALALPQGTVSRHLARLRDAGLVETRRDGAWAYYRVDPICSESEPLGQVLEVAVQGLPEAAADSQRLAEAQSAGGCC